MMEYYGIVFKGESLSHHGIKGMRWGVRRFQNPDGSLTPEGMRRYGVTPGGKVVKLKRLESETRKEKTKELEKLATKYLEDCPHEQLRWKLVDAEDEFKYLSRTNQEGTPEYNKALKDYESAVERYLQFTGRYIASKMIKTSGREGFVYFLRNSVKDKRLMLPKDAEQLSNDQLIKLYEEYYKKYETV